MVVRLGNGFYFMYIAFAAAYLTILCLCLRKKSVKTVRVVLLTTAFLNFGLHFLKLAFPPYINGLPSSLQHSTLENICAVTTLFLPFVFLFEKQNFLHDYFYFIGLIGGLAAIIYPTEALGEFPFTFDVIRFYFCHSTLFVVPLVAALCGLYKPRLKMFWVIPLMFLVQEALVAINEVCLVKGGLVNGSLTDLLNKEFRNHSFVFGLKSDFQAFIPLVDPFIPGFLKTDAFGINGGTPFYFPVLWMTIPCFVYLIPVYIVVSSPFAITDLIKKRRLRKNK